MIMDAIGVARRLGVEISTGDEKVGDEEAVDLLVSKGVSKLSPPTYSKINNRGTYKQQQEPQ